MQPVAHIGDSLHIGQPTLQVAGKLKRDAGRGPGMRAHTHVEGQAYVHGFKLLGMHKPASNVRCELGTSQGLPSRAMCVHCKRNGCTRWLMSYAAAQDWRWFRHIAVPLPTA